jgi:splicing factor 3B subunit 2
MHVYISIGRCTESEEEESEDEEEDEEDLITSGHAPDEGLRTPSGLETPSGMQTVVSTVPGGLETPDFLQLRKDTAESEVSATPVPRELYQVIPERQTNSRGFMGSSTAYDVTSLGGAPASGPRVLGQDDRGTKVSWNPVLSVF